MEADGIFGVAIVGKRPVLIPDEYDEVVDGVEIVDV